MAGDIVKRLNFFTGQFLEATDFKTEQVYHIDMRRAGNRALYYSAGILDGGFVVESAGDNAIKVSAGIAVDADGRELIIISPLEEILPSVETKEQVFFITLAYKERLEDKQTASVDDVSDYTRWVEKPEIKFVKEGNSIDQNLEIVIAKFTLGTDGKIKGNIHDSDSVRQYARARFPNDVTIGQGQAGVNRELNLSYEFDAAGSAKIRAYRGSSWDTYLQFLTNPTNSTEDSPQVRLHIDQDGKVGIGTSEPQSTLHVVGDLYVKDQIVSPQLHLDGDLYVKNQINCPQWKTTHVITRAQGPLYELNGDPRIKGILHSAGGTILIFAFGTGSSKIAGKQIGMQIQISGDPDNLLFEAGKVYAHEASSHKIFTGVPIILKLRGKGDFTFTLLGLNQDTQTNGDDFFDVTVLELPFGPSPEYGMVRIEQRNVRVPVERQLQFAAIVSETPDKRLTWTAARGTITGGSDTEVAADGPGGLYTAPVEAGPDYVTATSVADLSKSDMVTVNVEAKVVVSIYPEGAGINLEGEVQFEATVTGTPNKAVTWSVFLGSGTIDSRGRYTAPDAGAGTDTVKATSVADPTKSATATVNFS